MALSLNHRCTLFEGSRKLFRKGTVHICSQDTLERQEQIHPSDRRRLQINDSRAFWLGVGLGILIGMLAGVVVTVACGLGDETLNIIHPANASI